MSMSTMMYADMTASLVGCEHENDREPDPPHGHLVAMAGGSLAELRRSDGGYKMAYSRRDRRDHQDHA